MTWARVKEAAAYHKVSERKMWDLKKAGYPHLKVGNTIIFDLANGDNWMRDNFTPDPPLDIDAMLRGM